MLSLIGAASSGRAWLSHARCVSSSSAAARLASAIDQVSSDCASMAPDTGMGVSTGAAARIAQEALKADVTLESLAKLAHTDAAFAMKLLALVNSPAFARSRTVSDINQAASLLGLVGNLGEVT